MFQKLIPALVLGTLLVGCSMNTTERSDVADQKNIFQQYVISYDGKTDRIGVSAQFRIGSLVGPSLRLVGKSSIQHDTLVLKEETSGSTSYRAEAAGYLKRHRFVFVDSDGKEYANTIELPDLAVPRALPAASRAADLTVRWDGTPVAPNEQVVVKIVDAKGTQLSDSVNEPGRTSITIPAARVATLEKGNATVSFGRVRFSDPLTNKTAAGGLVMLFLTTNEQPITIND